MCKIVPGIQDRSKGIKSCEGLVGLSGIVLSLDTNWSGIHVGRDRKLRLSNLPQMDLHNELLQSHLEHAESLSNGYKQLIIEESRTHFYNYSAKFQFHISRPLRPSVYPLPLGDIKIFKTSDSLHHLSA